MKTLEDLTNENLKTIIIDCGWKVEELGLFLANETSKEMNRLNK